MAAVVSNARFFFGGEREGKLWRGETVTILHHGESRDASVSGALSETSYLDRFGFSFRGGGRNHGSAQTLNPKKVKKNTALSTLYEA